MASRIAIIGTGLIGTSIGLALKKARLGYEIVGHDKDHATAGKAKQRGGLDKTEWNLINAVEGAGLVILALPVAAIKPTLEAVAPYLAEGCVVTDTATTKQQVLAWARVILPTTASFIGGHPLVTRQGSGPDAASADLFNGVTYCLMPAPGAKPEAVQLLVGMATTLGAEPFFPDPVEHDNFQAAVAHLPILMATALVNVAAGSPASREMRKMTGNDFRQASALAEGDAATSALICNVNRDAILRWLDAYIAEMGRLREMVRSGGDELEAMFDKAADARARWLSRADDERAEAARQASETSSDQMRRFFLGELGKKIGK